MMTTHPRERVNYNCSVVNQPVTVLVLKADIALQMKGCTSAHVCKRFGDPPTPAAFSSPLPNGCPYYDSLGTSVKSGPTT
jgi:hypothetical protein